MQRRKQEAPTSVKITARSPLTNNDAEQMLTEHLETTQASATVKSQLNRMQRDLRGLPPLVKSHSADVGTHPEQGAEAMDTTEDKPISKEERKRQKKERRKQEQREKAKKKKEESGSESDSDSSDSS